jgi:hypothetical protein
VYYRIIGQRTAISGKIGHPLVVRPLQQAMAVFHHQGGDTDYGGEAESAQSADRSSFVAEQFPRYADGFPQ